MSLEDNTVLSEVNQNTQKTNIVWFHLGRYPEQASPWGQTVEGGLREGRWGVGV